MTSVDPRSTVTREAKALVREWLIHKGLKEALAAFDELWPPTVQAPVTSLVTVLRGEAIGVLVQDSIKVEHTVAGYLMFARDQWPSVMEWVKRLNEEHPTQCDIDEGRDLKDVLYESAAYTIALRWKQSGQKMRRKCCTLALLQMPHTSHPDLTPLQVEWLLAQLCRTEGGDREAGPRYAWCINDYSYDEEQSDDDVILGSGVTRAEGNEDEEERKFEEQEACPVPPLLDCIDIGDSVCE